MTDDKVVYQSANTSPFSAIVRKFYKQSSCTFDTEISIFDPHFVSSYEIFMITFNFL